MTRCQKIARCGLVAIAVIVGLFLLNIYRLSLQIRATGLEARRVITQADRGELLVASEYMFAEFREGAQFVSQGSAGRPSLESALLIGTNVPLAIRELNPHEIIVDTERVSVRLRPLSRSALLWYADSTKDYGSVHLTNGLWFFDELNAE